VSAFLRLRDGWPGPDAPLRVLAASGQLGLGIPGPAFREGLSRRPHVVAADMGSADPGPAYLGSGSMAAPEALVRRDLALMLEAARAADVPLLIGSAGTAGAAPHLDATAAILREVAAERGLSFRLATIRADLPEALLLRALEQGRLSAIGPIGTTPEAVGGGRIVGQMGLSAFARALETGADVVLAGRACDTAPFAVVPVLLGYPAGPAIHMAKILECTSLCCTPGGRDAMLATLRGDGFTLESMAPERAATPLSVAAHALYEQADPDRIDEPEGHADLTEARYEAADERRCSVSGATWSPRAAPTIRVEGARQVGHRALMLAAAADPAFIAASEALVAETRHAVARLIAPDPADPWRLEIRRYGIDGVIEWPGPPETPPREVFLMAEALAPDAATARGVAAAARQHLMHAGFPGRLATAGNLAFPLVPAEFDAGPAYAFTLCHILQLESRAALDALFPVQLEEVAP